MSKRKRRSFLFGREPIEGCSGYSISVTYDKGGKPVVQVETHGDVDVTELRRDIKERYLGARIDGLEKQQLIRIVDEKEDKKKTELIKEERKEKGRSPIRVVE